MKTNKGFTVIELLLTLLLMGLFFTIGALKFDFITNYQEKLEVEEVVLMLNEARNNAISTGYTSKVLLSSKDKTISIRSNNKDFESLKLKHLSMPFEFRTFTFKSTGAPSVSGSYELRGKKKAYRITVEIATGKVNLSERKI
ncbi:MAG: prepilin-type N-terminal cleavage/methylation domain-containing protein [Lagierella massiliensis]|nr:prepilin-type N-terminal cleavage/methylation domain-containing protein [Lagierella massiliensis]